MNRKIEKLAKTTTVFAQPDVSHVEVGRASLLGSMTRAQKILRTYAGDSTARSCLQAAGFDASVYEEGWRLLRRAYGDRDYVPAAPEQPSGVVALIARIEAEASSVFGRVHAVLNRFYPAQAAFVFDGLTVASGIESVVALQTLLDRIDELEKGTSKANQKQEHAVMLALEARGVKQDLRARLRKLCEEVQSAPPPVKPPPAPEPDTQGERELRLRELYAWVIDWSETARCVISDKRILRRLGLGKRRARAPKPAPAPVPTPVPPPVAVSPVEAAAE